jgi:O-antigen/teichoic acid export membrane protein
MATGKATRRTPFTPRSLVLNAGFMAVAGVVAQICFTAIEAMIARRLGQHAYGIYGNVFAISQTTAWVVEAGMGWKIVQDGSRQPAEIPGLLGTTLALKAIFGAILGPVMFLVLQAAGYVTEGLGLFAFLFAYTVLLTFQDSLAAVNAARNRMYVTALFQGAAPVAIGAGVLLLRSPSLIAVGAAYLLGGGLVTGVWALRMFLAERPRVELGRTREILRGSWHYGLTGGLSQVYWRTDVMLLPLLRGFQEVGLFAAADKISDLGFKVGILCTRVLTPVLFEQSQNDPAAYARTCKLVVRGASLAGVLGCLVVALLAEPLVTLLFGAKFRPAAAILVVLAAGLAARLVGITLQLVQSASGQHAWRNGAQTIALGSAVVFNLALAPGFGALGAAAARLISGLIHAATMLMGGGLPFHKSAAASWILWPAALGVLSYVAARMLHAGAIVEAVAGIALYGLGAVVSRAVRLSEVRELMHAMRTWPRPSPR